MQFQPFNFFINYAFIHPGLTVVFRDAIYPDKCGEIFKGHLPAKKTGYKPELPLDLIQGKCSD